MAIQNIYLLIINLLLFILLGVDKKRAMQHAWRIPEKKLLLLGIFGGGIGGLLGMKVFRHKTKHAYFTVSYLAGVILTGIAYYFYGL